MSDISPDDINRLIEKLRQEHGLDFRGYKLSSLGRRIQRRLDQTKSPDVAAYLELLDQNPDEYSRLVDSILINVTEFFRDPEAWDIIRSEVLPRIVEGKRPGDRIRFWSAGCATGEEAYSLAISLVELLGPRVENYDARVYATDVDEKALAAARRGEYTDAAVKTLPPDLLEKYFVNGVRWSVRDEVRGLVVFDTHNLTTDEPLSQMDLVACRNILIYMSVDLQSRVLAKLHGCLEPGGFLFLGKAESLFSASRLFTPVSERWRIFRKGPFDRSR